MSRHGPDTPDSPRRLYLHAADRLDAGTAARLRAARREALAAPRRASRAAWALPAGAFAATVLAVGLAWWQAGTAPALDPAAQADAEAIESLMVEEDPEFYAWLAEAPVATRAETRR